jgi:DNA-binding HxlR family transcriptional regulator
VREYGQYCPIARSSEVLAERWTPIIVRNLLNGCHTFSEIRQGALRIPTALLSQRLETLERAGVLIRQPAESGRGFRYQLTPMGQELRVVFDAMGQWGRSGSRSNRDTWTRATCCGPRANWSIQIGSPGVLLSYGSISPTPRIDTESSCDDRNRSCALDRAAMSRTWSVQLAPAALSICIFAGQHIRAPCATAAWR